MNIYGKVNSSLNTMVKEFDSLIAVDDSYDLLKRRMTIGGRQACLYFVDGFAADDMIQKILQYFYSLTAENMAKDACGFLDTCLPAGEVSKNDDLNALIKELLAGQMLIFIDGYSECILVDSREYPARSVESPDKDKVLRGSKDSFVETMVFNSALIRRRIRSTKLVMKAMELGRSSRTDLCLCYMSDRVNKKLLNKLNEKLRAIDVDALTMNQESLSECLHLGSWLNPFPKVKFTERPDAAAACVLEGSVVILVDNSPMAMIIPTSLFDIVEEANDYYFPPITGTYLRLSRFVINLLALFLTPIFLLVTQNPEWIPSGFEFINVKSTMNVPLIWQFLILEFAIDGLRMAAINTPNMLNTPLSIIAGLVIGQFTVDSGWFNAEAMLYMAFVTLANYSQVSMELSYALKFMRIINLVLTSLFGIWGFAAGVLLSVLSIALNRTIAGFTYLSPLIPFNGKQLLRRFFRISLPTSEKH